MLLANASTITCLLFVAGLLRLATAFCADWFENQLALAVMVRCRSRGFGLVRSTASSIMQRHFYTCTFTHGYCVQGLVA